MALGTSNLRKVFEMEDYEKTKLRKLEDLERRVSSAVEYFGNSIKVIWFVVALGVPTLMFLAPVKEDRTLQATLMFLLVAFCFGLAKADKAIGKLK